MREMGAAERDWELFFFSYCIMECINSIIMEEMGAVTMDWELICLICNVLFIISTIIVTAIVISLFGRRSVFLLLSFFLVRMITL